MSASASSTDRARHWDDAYDQRGITGVSWFQDDPRISLEMIDALEVSPTSAVIDIGGGTSVLAEKLVGRGFLDVTVVDVSQSALDLAAQRCGAESPIRWVCADLLQWEPDRQFDLWHDRAVFHFLVDAGDRERYLTLLGSALKPGGLVIIATFAPDGPEYCSGLPVARYGPDQLESLLGREFTPERQCREEHLTPSAVVQPFTWLAARRSSGTGQ